MRSLTRTILITAALLFLPAPSSFAQAAADPSGHWEGTVDVPNTPIKIGFDVAPNEKGALAGTFNTPAEHIKGLPLASVTVQGRSVTLLIKAGGPPSTFTGTLSDDGKSIAGTWSQSNQSAPFTLTRTGDAVFTPVPTSAAIGKELIGTWTGALDFAGKPMRIVLTMANQPDGTATGTVMSPDGSGMDIAIVMTQKGRNLTVDAPTVGASFAGALNADASELAGMWTQVGMALPLVFKRAAK